MAVMAVATAVTMAMAVAAAVTAAYDAHNVYDDGESLGRQSKGGEDGAEGGADDQDRRVVVKKDEAAKSVGSVPGQGW